MMSLSGLGLGMVIWASGYDDNTNDRRRKPYVIGLFTLFFSVCLESREGIQWLFQS